MGDLFLMWALVEVLGIVCLPLTFVVFHNLADRGWALSKALGLVVLTFCIWLPLVSLPALVFNQRCIMSVLASLLMAGLVGLVWARQEVLKMLRHNLRYVLASEAVFLGMLLLMGSLRILGPEIHGDEGFMDVGLIASIMRSSHLPPPDMWMSGYTVNYYYYMQYMVALLARLTGQTASTAFNTGMCTMYGLCAVNVFGVTCNIIAWARQQRRQQALITAEGVPPEMVKPALRAAVPYGLFGCVLALIFGNPAAIRQWWIAQHDPRYIWMLWNGPAYVLKPLGKTLNQFPVYTFLLVNAHAHALTLPFTVLALGLALNLLLDTEGRGFSVFGRGWRMATTFLLTAIVLGGLYVMNGWDYPTYLGVAVVCIALQQWLAHAGRLSWSLARHIALVAGSLLALSYLLYLPYYQRFISPALGLGLVGEQERSLLSDEFWIYAFFAFLFLSLVLVSAFLSSRPPKATTAEEESVDPQPRWKQMRHTLFIAGSTLYPILCLLCLKLIPNSGTFVLSASLAVVTVVVLLQHTHDRAHTFVLLLGAIACALVAFCEIFYLRDAFANSDNERANTVFKFYYQAWVLLSIACAAGVFFILERLKALQATTSRQRPIRRIALGGWTTLLIVFSLAHLVYPLSAPYSRYARIDKGSPLPHLVSAGTLDGMAYMKNCQPNFCTYRTAPDYDAIRWLNKNVQGTPVIIESVGYDYSEAGRVSAFTGLPTLMGWVGHEYQWRLGYWYRYDPNFLLDYSRRVSDIDQIYTNKNNAKVLSLIRYYQARYLYVGPLERTRYPRADLKRYSKFMRTIYNANGVTIYEVR